MVFLPNNNRIVQIQVLLYASYHVPAAKTNMRIICEDHFTIFSFFGAITQLLLPIKGGIGELSNKAVTDFEIAKTLLDFPSRFN
jgi:hypothetical protein